MAVTLKPARAVDPALQSALNACGFVGTWETDLETKTVYPSGAFATLIGVDEEAARAGISLNTFLDGVHPSDRERVHEAVKVAHSTAGRFESEFRMVGGTGSYRWVAARGQVEKDAQGRGFRCLGVAVDVTDTRNAESLRGPDAVNIVNHLVDAMVAARALIGTLGTPILKNLIDMLLIELQRELRRRTLPEGNRRLQ
ncbi:PAS domain-containing protein [Methylobacterium sp. C25]|uniref:PAS domain-containing protein n=1 Tax=Methylobacterium sp. C25 TaxID=2721622 RepID=UPI001F2CE21F|nr:PAS domain-containing protein [Methylobacterium sp. C25]MCE4224177.1 PAS domain-containing protein [Methylobacterium sp. C25]